MKTARIFALMTSAAVLGGCAAAPEPLPLATQSGPCPIIGSSDWSAWVNAMPGDPTRPTLIVVGRVTVPTGGYGLSLEAGPVVRTLPPVQQLELRVTPPAGMATQAVVIHDVRAELPALDSYGAVTIRCGSDVLRTISTITVAH